MIICEFEHSPSIPSFLVTKIVYIGYGQLKKMTPFPFTFPAFIFISYCCLCQCQAVCYYYMPVSTKYHWNISFPKFFSSKYVVKNARKVTQFVWQTFSIEFQGFVKKKRIKYIHQNLKYYETIEQIHFMVVKK